MVKIKKELLEDDDNLGVNSAKKRRTDAPCDRVVDPYEVLPADAKRWTFGRVDKDRVRVLVDGKVEPKPVVCYWMHRDKRISDNWALIHALTQAREREGIAVVLYVVDSNDPYLTDRRITFLLEGLKEVCEKCKGNNIHFFIRVGSPQEEVLRFVKENHVAMLVSDFSPLRQPLSWKGAVASALDIPFHEVDAHNLVPMWLTSQKLEYAARTIRPKIHKNVQQFLKKFPEVTKQNAVDVKNVWSGVHVGNIDWDDIRSKLNIDTAVGPLSWCQGGEGAAHRQLNAFLSDRLRLYTQRNDPNVSGTSELSPWLNFGFISAQRVVTEALKHKSRSKEAVDSFFEELVIRRELSDNFCFHNTKYDTFDGFHDWARKTLDDHRSDRREYTYTFAQLEGAKTHDELWNAAQLEVVHRGKMHGFMRMYWAKKILEWTASPEEALSTAITFNDRYAIDGYDPNGFVGCAWSIGGIHDQGWKERPVFGKIRFMNYQGCKRKFQIETYVRRMYRLAGRK